MVPNSYTCPFCREYSVDSLNSMRIHCSKIHKSSSKDLYAALFLQNGKIPECACGCGKTPRFQSLQKGYSEYVLGHYSRVSNNWGSNESVRLKSLDTRRREGKWNRNPWNKGKTKENDHHLRALSETMKERHGERYSKLMSNNRLTRAIPSLVGPNHPRWKGGTSSISALCNSNNRLYDSWKYPALKESGFKCKRCSETKNLHVHHSETRMAEIIGMCSPPDAHLSDLSWDEKQSWVDRVIEWHVKNKPPAEVLCNSCHSDEHPSLNFAM